MAPAAGRDARRADRALRRLLKTLGPIREADVARAVLEETARAADWPPAIVGRVDRGVAKRRDRAWTPIHAALEALDTDDLLAELEGRAQAITCDAADAAVARALAGRVRQRAAELGAAIDRAGTLYRAETLHAIRIAAKKLRYVVELAPAAPGWRMGADARRLRRVQVMLGALRDFQSVQTEIRRAAARAGARRATLRALAEMDRDLEVRCRATHAAFLRVLPGLRALSTRLVRAVVLGALKPRPARMSFLTEGRRKRRSGGINPPFPPRLREKVL